MFKIAEVRKSFGKLCNYWNMFAEIDNIPLKKDFNDQILWNIVFIPIALIFLSFNMSNKNELGVNVDRKRTS